jgi:hypothetical protein
LRRPPTASTYVAEVHTQESDPDQTASAIMICDEFTDEESSSSVPCDGSFQRPYFSSRTRRDSIPYVNEEFNFATLDLSRGRTQKRVEHTHSFSRPRPESRASSASSARSMIDDRLEWAQQDRERSASRAPSLPPSPFCENSPFHAEHARRSSMAAPPRLTNDCYRNDVQFQERRWSCDALTRLHTRPKTIFHQSTTGSHVCKICRWEFMGYPPDEVLSSHLTESHNFGECNDSRLSFGKYHFRNHLNATIMLKLTLHGEDWQWKYAKSTPSANSLPLHQ